MRIKKRAKVGLLVIASVSVLAISESKISAESGTTEVGIIFSGGTANRPIKPGTDSEISLPAGSSTQGELRIEHVPNFNFGKQTSNGAAEVNYQALYSDYQTEDNKTFKIPSFVQVTDVRDNSTSSSWSLQVKQEELLTNGSHQLKNTRIYIHEQTLTNNQATVSKLEGLVGLNSQPKRVPVGSQEGSLQILRATESVAGSTSSLVFKDNYQENQYGEGSSLTDQSTNTGIQLHVPGSDKPLPGAYSATLIWNLSNAD